MRDACFLVAFVTALVIGAQVYAVTGWPMPGLIDKSAAMPAAS